MTGKQLATALKQQRDEVIAAWLRVERARTGDHETTEKELTDDLPNLLSEIADALARGSNLEKRLAASAHAVHRWRSGMSLERLTGEYMSLRQVLSDFAPHQLASGDEACKLLHRLIDDALGDCVTVYVQHMTEALNTERQRFEVALRHAPIVTFEQDYALRYVWVHPPSLSGQLVGRRDCDIIDDQAAICTIAQLKQEVLSLGEARHGEFKVTVDRVQRHYQLWMQPARDAQGQVCGLLGAATDVTEKSTQEAILRDALELRERIIGIVSHDLRNPLNAIELSTESLLRKPDTSERQRTVLQRLRQAAHRANRLINELLDYTRLRAGGLLPVNRIECDARAIASQVVSEVALTYPERTVTLEQPPGPLTIWADPDRLMQAVMNLVRNALQHSRESTEVNVAVSAAPDGETVFEVRNQGEPIPSEQRAALFEPFVRGRMCPGSLDNVGLGLFIVRQITLAHEGTVEVQSSLQNGTTFAIKLPKRSSGSGVLDKSS